jgi:hypothetical protein
MARASFRAPRWARRDYPVTLGRAVALRLVKIDEARSTARPENP